MRMLVVDDEAEIADMLAEYFTLEGFEVTCANSGSEALVAAPRGFDIILLDVNMPGMDGFEVCRRIREHLSCPIIFLTARIEDVDQLDGFAAGADDYVLKPFSLPVLGRRVAAHMAREGRSRQDDLRCASLGSSRSIMASVRWRCAARASQRCRWSSHAWSSISLRC